MVTRQDPNPISTSIVDIDEVDISQLRRNLSLTVEERLNEHQNALDLVFDLENAGMALREKSQ